MEVLFSGQALELYWKFHRQCPSMSDYLVMIDNKTGGFFRLVMRMMATEYSSSVTSDDKIAFSITLLGRYYQIRDDYQNLTSDEVCLQYIHPGSIKHLFCFSFLSPLSIPDLICSTQYEYPLTIT